jgi:hypothetical protein
LGVYIDEHLTWKDHISCISKKISKSVGILHRSRFNLSSKTKLSLYYTLIYPYITYCNLAWSSTYVTNLNIMIYLQKRAVRIITNAEFRAHSAPLFTQFTQCCRQFFWTYLSLTTRSTIRIQELLRIIVLKLVELI